MKSKVLISALLCLSLVTPNIVYATELPPNTDIPGHIGLVEEQPQQEEEPQEPDYNCSFGCSHLPSEPHNYKPFNVYGESKTSYMGKARAATITIDLTSTGGAGQAPLKCLTQYERDGTQHWERCINHPGTGTYNGLYHNAGRINLSNHTLSLTNYGDIDCSGYTTSPIWVCGDAHCGYSRALQRQDFPLTYKGVRYVYTDILCYAKTANWVNSGIRHHYIPCEDCGFYSGYQNIGRNSLKSWCRWPDGQDNLHKFNSNLICTNCGDKKASHLIDDTGETVNIGHGNGTRKCLDCPITVTQNPTHYGWEECFYCPLNFTRTHEEATWVSGNPYSEPTTWRFRTVINPALTFQGVSSSTLIGYFTENQGVFQNVTATTTQSGGKLYTTVTSPKITDTAHQTFLRVRLDTRYYGIAPDGLRFDASSYVQATTTPDKIAPYAGTASPQNGTPSAWRDSVDVVVKAKDVWSESLKFQIFDSDKVSQLGQTFTTGTKDTSGYYNASFKLIAEASAPKNIYLRATDLSGNYSDFGFQVQYVDTYAPRIQAPVVDNTIWARTKSVRFNSIEAGSRETKMSFNDGTVWNVCNQSGDTYYQDYIFTGDVYTAQTRPIFFKDKLNNTSQAMFTINRIDNTKPTITAVTAKSNAIKTESTITVSANDTKAGLGEGSGVKLYAMTTANIAPTSGWQSSNTFKTNTNGTYWLWVKDGVDLMSTSYSVTVSDLDKIAPVLKLTAPSNWTNGNVTITAQATDENSGVSYITLPNGSNVSSANTTFTATANGTYTFTAFDKAGNSDTESIEITCIDRVAPTLSLSASPAWRNDFVDITAVIADDYSGIAQLRNPDGSITTAATSSYRVTENGNYSFTVTDKAGNPTIKSIAITTIDKVKPSISLTAPTDWTNQDVPISFIGTDDYSGVQKIVLPDGNEISSTNEQFIATSNKTYTFNIYDNAGNIFERSIDITCIDRVKPSIVLTASPDWTNQPVTIKAVATDDYSGVLSIEDPDGIVHSKDSLDFVVDQNGTYTFKVTDKAGNDFVQSITVSSIDYVVPTISLSAPTDWTNQPFDITIETNDDYSGVARIKLPDNTEPTEATSFEISQNGVYYFTVYDKAGNSTTDSIEVTCFDYVKPTAESSNLPTWWFVRPHEIKVTSDDDYSGVRRIQTPDGEWHDADEVTYFVFENKEFPFVIEDNAGNTYTLNVPIDLVENTDPTIEVTGNNDEWTNKDVKINIKASDSQSDIRGISLGGDKWDLLKEVNYLFTGNGEYTIVAEDNVGHRAEQKVLINKIDKEAPTASYTVTPKEWTKGDVTVKISAQDALSGLRSVSGSQSFTLSSNGTMHMQIEDNAGNVLDLPIEVKNIDKDNPVIEGIGIADISRGQAPLLIATSDKTSPITKIEYQLVELNGKVNDEAWIAWEDGTKVNAPFHGDVAARCFDSAGNVSEVLRKEFMIDPIPPRARARMSTLKPTTEPITISYSAEDMESGFNYTILPDKVITNEPEVEYKVETNGNYTFQSYDFAGNTKSTKIAVTNLDKDPPLGKVTQFPTEWTKGDVQLHLTATDASSVTRFEPVDQTATSNGDYIFYLEDEHGNKTELKHKVSNIDRIAPTISGSASNFIASIYVQDYESGVKQTVTPLGSSSSATVMFSVSPNSSYAISAIDNAGNTATRTLFVNAEGNGAFDEVPPTSSNPNNGTSGGSNGSSGKDEINTSKPETKPTHPKPEDGDYGYGKPNKNYPDGVQGGYQDTETSSSSSSHSSSSASSEASSSNIPPHLSMDTELSDSSNLKPNEEANVDKGMKAPTIIVESTQQPNSLFEPDLYLKQIGDSLVALGSLNLGNNSIGFKIALGVGAMLAVCWIVWVIILMVTALRGLKKTKEEDKDSEEDDFEA